MYNWVQMINCFSGFGDITLYLDIADIPHELGADQHIQTMFSLGGFGVKTIVNKVVPAAMAETMGWTFGD